MDYLKCTAVATLSPAHEPWNDRSDGCEFGRC
jgi:hypothetical protein